MILLTFAGRCGCLIVMLAAGSAMAMSPACPPIEYAQLKDSTRDELNAFYCKATKARDAHSGIMRQFMEYQNSSISRTGRMRPDNGEFASILESESSCIRQADSVASMLKKQFQAEPPVCEPKSVLNN